MPRPWLQRISSSNSMSLTPRSATALILTWRPACWAASRPRITWSRSPQRVSSRNLVAVQRVHRHVHAAHADGGQFLGVLRELAAVGGERELVQRAAVEMPAQPAEQRHHVLAHQRLAAGQPELPDAAPDEGRAQSLQLLEREHLGLGQEGHVLGHAIDAAEVAAIRHRDAQVGNMPAEGVDHVSNVGRLGPYFDPKGIGELAGLTIRRVPATASERPIRARVSRSRLPIRGRSRSRRTLTTLSAMTCETLRNPFAGEGSIVMRKSGAPTIVLVIGRIETVACDA